MQFVDDDVLQVLEQPDPLVVVGQDAGVELYDHQTGPGEDENVADRPEREAVITEMAKTLRAGWKGALPPK